MGVLDDKLSDSLQIKADLDLAKAVQLCHQSEARKDNRDIVRGDTKATSSIDHVAKRKCTSHKPKPKGQPRTQQHTQDSKSGSCKWCGRTSHPRRNCPAIDAICDNCARV